METCAICSRTFKDRRGLSGHQQFKHTVAASIQQPEALEHSGSPEALPERSGAHYKGVGLSDECPGCLARDFEIDRLKDALTEVKAAGPQARAEAESRVKALEGQLVQAQREAEAKVSAAESRAQQAIAQAQEAANKPTPWPTVAEFIGHCEGGQCSQHKGEWDRVKTGIIEAAWKNIPDRIIEERGEALGLIPTRIKIRL